MIEADLEIKEKEVFNTKELKQTTARKKSYSPPVISGFPKYIIARLMWLNIALISLKYIWNPLKLLRAKKKMKSLLFQFLGTHKILKLAKVDGHYYMDMYSTSWPSLAFNNYITGELNRVHPFKKTSTELRTMIFAITKKCPLRCEHCFEWDVLNGKEKLSLQDLKQILKKFQDRGVAQVQLSGGEPLVRLNDMIELIKTAETGTDFWILTSGYNLTLENAIKLKNAGLKGVAISLDHFEPELHNKFRGFQTAYEWVEKAVDNAHKAKLIISLTLCATKDFVSEANMMTYAQLAKGLGAAFIQVLEPRAVGHYSGKNVALSDEQLNVLEKFYLRLNYDPKFIDMPIVTYHGYHQRYMGCFGAGSRYLYIDTDGDLHACPFCQKKTGNVLSSSTFEESLSTLKATGCHQFENAAI